MADEDEGLTAEEWKELGGHVKNAGKMVLGGWKTLGGALKSRIMPAKPPAQERQQNELARLQAEVTMLEQKKAMEKQIKLLKEKKASLTAKPEEEEDEDEDLSFA